MNAHLTLALDFFQELKCLFPYDQHEQTSSYLLRKLLHFYHNYRWVVNKHYLYQIQFLILNICTYQYQL